MNGFEFCIVKQMVDRYSQASKSIRPRSLIAEVISRVDERSNLQEIAKGGRERGHVEVTHHRRWSGLLRCPFRNIGELTIPGSRPTRVKRGGGFGMYRQETTGPFSLPSRDIDLNRLHSDIGQIDLLESRSGNPRENNGAVGIPFGGP